MEAFEHFSTRDGVRVRDSVVITSTTQIGPFYCPQPAHHYSYPPARYNSMLPPVPWIFRGDVNKPILVLLAMEAPMLLIAIVATVVGW